MRVGALVLALFQSSNPNFAECLTPCRVNKAELEEYGRSPNA
jgi:hypothetical protein